VTHYCTSNGRQVLPEELPELSEEEQVEIMKTWFRKRYEDPAHRTPYESAEGGYIWIWGGPHDADKVLGDEFGSIVREGLIGSLVRDLEGECVQWAPTAYLDEYDDDFLTDIAAISDYHANFLAGLEAVRELAETRVGGETRRCLFRLLYTNVITALEAFLSDAFSNTVLNNSGLLRRFIENTPDFARRKISLSDAFTAVDDAERTAKDHLRQIVWHRLDMVKRMYSDVLDVEFPDTESMSRAVRIRHHLVHRNGKTRDGRSIPIDKNALLTVVAEAEEFVRFVDQELETKTVSPEDSPTF